MNAPDYDKQMRGLLGGAAGKRLLLHSCCAPCSSHCLSEVAPFIGTTVFFYNPNLDTAEEYARRRDEQVRFLGQTGLAGFLDGGYDPAEFERVARGLEEEPERGRRCTLCYALRLGRTAREARERGYDYFATTLTLSPHKDAARLNEIGFALAEQYGVSYLPSDFKKRGGFLHSVELSRQYGLYRQNYCGCRYSKQNRGD